FKLFIAFALAVVLPLFSAHSNNKPIKPRLTLFHAIQYNGLQWRNVGPFRGGRCVTVAGVTNNPMVYYMGTTGGGVWKTQDAGLSWNNISDRYFNTSSIGAIAVSESNPNIIYVGTGEHPVRGVMTSAGDGVYKSYDGGSTWEHMGLIRSEHISSIVIHPDNPDWVYVAVQGSLYGDSESRGIYVTTDGGKSWKKSLYINSTTGSSDLSMDPNNPRILYAGMWDHQRTPWQIRSGGPGSGIYKSIDGGENWQKLCKGLPTEMGKVGVDVSPVDGSRVYAMVESHEGGLFRSDDYGETWTPINKERKTIARAWYYTKVVADPTNKETVFVLNAPLLKSTDGGKSFTSINTPHSDQHALWINPKLSNNYILANDGGSCITFTDGKSWSSQNNQPTGQFYRVITDNRFPYYIYGGQQDNSTVAIPSRTNHEGIDVTDWYTVSGCESAFIAFDPDHPDDVYGGCYQGYISIYNEETKEEKDIMAYPALGLATNPEEMKYRFNWNAPIVAQPQNPNVIYHAANVVLSTEDKGINWSVISPELTRNEKSKQGLGGIPFTNEGAGAENYNTISYLAASQHAEGTLWVGTDDGLVHYTKDEGKHWHNVTPPDLGEALINSIEISKHNPKAVYVVATRYKFNDRTPIIYYSNDWGKNWSLITGGIQENHFVRVVREDPKVPGLLYAGTENGLYISLNNGQRWFPFQLNLPNCPITDLTIKDNDLIAATSGRGYWILDDIGSIQQTKGVLPKNQALLIQPKPTYRYITAQQGSNDQMGQNPLNGVIIDYYLPKNFAEDVRIELEIIDPSGHIIRTYSNQKTEGFLTYEGGPKEEPVLTSNGGINRFNWDMKGYAIPGIENVFMHGSYTGATVAPGEYQMRLKTPVGIVEQSIFIKPDPRIDATQEDYAIQQEVLKEIEANLREIHLSVIRMKDVNDQLQFFVNQANKAGCANEIIEKGNNIIQQINQWEAQLIQRDQETFQDAINHSNKLNAEFAALLDRVDAHDPVVTSGVMERLRDLNDKWKTHKASMLRILEEDVETFNELYKNLNVPLLVVPSTNRD
ncbi:MAG: glycosyl hydrolase, partial [Bacteroidota bacterium]